MNGIDDDPLRLSLENLQSRCHKEMLSYLASRQSDSRFCFEIFRRAIVEKDQPAWEIIDRLYRGQVIRWVRRHPRFSSCDEDEDYLANRALEKFWQAISPEKFARFPELKHLLSYLQMCVHSVLTDHLREIQRNSLEIRAGLRQAEQLEPLYSLEDRAGAKLQAEESWQAIVSRLHDLKELEVARDAFLLGLKPGDTFHRFPSLFRDNDEVYQVKENILERLRHDDEILKLMGLQAEKE